MLIFGEGVKRRMVMFDIKCRYFNDIRSLAKIVPFKSIRITVMNIRGSLT